MTTQEKVSPGYKQTEIGMIPEDWDYLSIAAIASRKPNAIVGGPFGSDLVSKDYVTFGIPVIRGQNMSGRLVSGDFVFVSLEKAKALSANTAIPGDLVFTQRGTLGQVCLVPQGPHENYVVSQSQMKISLDSEKCDANFVLHFFHSEPGQKMILDSAIQTGVPHTNLSILKSYKVPIPPPREQQAIAEALSEADARIAALEALIAKKHDLKQAAIQQLLTGKTRLPGFSGEWEVTRLGDVAQLYKNQLSPNQRPEDLYWHYSLPAFDDGETPLLQVGSDIGSNKFSIPTTCVLVSKLNPRIPRVWLVKNPHPTSVASTEFLVLIPKESVGYNFLEVICSSPSFLEQMKNSATGTTGSHQRVNPATALNFQITLPTDPNEQNAIAEILSDMDSEISALDDQINKARAIKQGMMQTLLTGKVRLV